METTHHRQLLCHNKAHEAGHSKKAQEARNKIPTVFVLSFHPSVLTLELLAGKDWGLAIYTFIKEVIKAVSDHYALLSINAKCSLHVIFVLKQWK